MVKVFNKEDLKGKAIFVKGGSLPEKIELYEDVIKVYKSDGVEEIPLNTIRGEAIKDRLGYSGELTQEICI